MLTTLLAQFSQGHFALDIFLLFLLPSLGLLLQRCIRQRRFARQQGCEAANSKVSVKDPIIGLDFLYDVFVNKTSGQYLDTIFALFQKLGSTYTVNRWTWTTFYTCDALNIKHMLASASADFELPNIRISILEKMFGEGIFSQAGHLWSRNRAVLRQGFRKRNPAALLEISERHFQEFLRNIPIGTQLDLQPIFFRVTMDIATEFLMGHSTGMLDPSKDDSREQQFVQDYNLLSAEAARQMQLGPLHHFRCSLKLKNAKTRMLQFVDTFIDKALQQPEASGQGSSLLHDLVATTPDRKTLQTQVLHILLASRDTTASLLSNLFFILAKKPQIYAKLRDEVLRVAGDTIPTAAHLKEMTYLKWCVNESLRLHPVIPSNAREALRDTTLPRGGGKDGLAPLFVPKGAIVIYTVYAMHRTETVFGGHVEDFIPERWDGLRAGWSYLPFNGGNRTCLGQQYALSETHYMVARMAQTFKTLESRDDEDWAELYALAMCSKNGTKVVVRN